MNPLVSMRLKLRDRLLRFYTDDLVRISRRRRANQLLAMKRAHRKPLSGSQKQDIIDFWKPYRNISSELGWFEFYNQICQDSDQLKFYIPESVYYSDIDTFFSNPRRAESMDDKNLYDLFFSNVRMPETIVRKTNGVLLDKEYQAITIQQALDLCKSHGCVISKKALTSGGGYGVYFIDFSTTTDEAFIEWLESAPDVNIQEIIHQHDCLNQIHDKSVNSIRIMSLLLDGQVHLLSSVLRMGRDGSQVDNASGGGLSCGIQSDGTLKEFAYDKTGARLSQHPQGAVFKGVKIVGYEKCCDIIRRHAGILSGVSRLMSWDFAIGSDGEPILIEVNLTYGGVTIHQMCNGPILGDLTPDILSRVYQHSK